MLIKKTVIFSLLSLTFSLLILGACGSLRNSDTDKDETTTERAYISDTVIIIDAGHGGEDGGAVSSSGIVEKELNLDIALKLAERLEKQGYKTRLTRDEDTLLYDRNADYEGRKKQLDLEGRLRIAKEYDDAIFISIHMNAFTDSRYRGLQVYYSPTLPSSSLLAATISDDARMLVDPANKRQIKPSEGKIYLLDNNPHTAVLVECGFLSNPDEALLLSTEEYREKLCSSIFISIVGFMEKNGEKPGE